MPRYRPGASRRTVSSRSGAISENAVVYSSSGGHNHDGANSSLIDVNKYSLWDFTLNTIYSTNDRTSKQNSHIEQFRNYVKNIIINDAFGAAGVTLGDNVINANNIVAGSISTDLLRTDAIKSTNYSYTSGNFSTAGTFLNLSDGSIISKEFFIDSSGNAGFAGAISGGTIDIGGIDSSSFHVNSAGDMWLGSPVYSGAPFRVSRDGDIVASSATITGTINADAGYLGSSTSGFDISSNSITSQDFVAGGENSGRGKLNLYSYGDIVIDSSPNSGPHSGQTYKTSIVGEYLYIEKTSSGDKPKILIGNTTGNTDDAAVVIYKNGSTKASMAMSSSAGNVLLYDSAGTLKINLVGSTGVLAGRTFQAYNSSGSMTAELKGSDGSIRAGNINGGYNNTNTNSIGQVTISHGLNAEPDFVVVTPAQHSSSTPDWNVQYVVTSKNSSTFTVTLYEGLNDTVASDTQACYWFAGFSVHT